MQRAEVRTNTETPFFYALLVMKADRFVCNEKEREGGCRDRVFRAMKAVGQVKHSIFVRLKVKKGHERKKVLVSGQE